MLDYRSVVTVSASKLAYPTEKEKEIHLLKRAEKGGDMWSFPTQKWTQIMANHQTRKGWNIWNPS